MIVCRSPLEVAEDAVLEVQQLASKRCISKQDAVRYSRDISCNAKFAEFIERGNELIALQGTMSIDEWIKRAEAYAWAYLGLTK